MSDIDTVGTPPVDEEEVIDSIEEVLDALGATMPDLLGPSPDGPDQAKLGVTTFRGTIAIIGDNPAIVTIDTDGMTAAKLAVGWSLSGPEGPALPDAIDAVGEFVNIVGGAVKAVFHAESSLGLPTVEPLEATTRSSDPDILVIDHPIGRIDIKITYG
ncbi:MAG: hypothetical protein GY724_10375 [Actinomycetia bacterium]|nr:hypothetical protein [Actinomycetes bacterium]MCP5035331.1 hypothetical protein [Actinomycetes bacterium]